MAAKPKYSKTPASLIYAQSWPVPASSSCFQRSPVRSSRNSQTKSLNNSPWICKPKQNSVRPQKVAKSHSWASCMLSNNYPGWTENDEYFTPGMAKEFRLTLQMFKELTEQVKEVDEQLNSGKKAYTFKHYFRNRDKGRLRTYTPEIPMTNEEYQPCNNLGIKREPCQAAIRKSRKTENPKSKLENQPLTSSSNMRKTKQGKWKIESSFHDENVNTNQILESGNEDLQTNLPIPCGLNIHYSDDDSSWSGCLGFSGEDNHVGLGYIDPVPGDWEAMKLEELEVQYCSEEGKSDPFMLRLLQIRRSEVETVEQEKRSEGNPNSVPCDESGVNKVPISNKGKKSTIAKRKNSKTNGAVENLEKNPQRVLKESSNHGKKKDLKILSTDKIGFHEDIEKDRKQMQKQHGERRTQCKSARAKRCVQNCKARPMSYSSSISYDILELATTFDPPCKERIKLNPSPVTAKSAKSKGMIPGKTWTSQRRFSLTAGQSVQSLPSDGGDTIICKSRTSSAKKSIKTKRNSKRCRSSKF